MCCVIIVDKYKYRWLRRDLLHVCNEFPLCPTSSELNIIGTLGIVLDT